MTVSKRLRFEILRRDNYTCRYCGGEPPDIKLTVDHVVPVSLGGSDEPSNLVAACKDCNAGKASVPIDGVIVDDVTRRARDWSAAVASNMDAWREDRYRIDDALSEFEEAWRGWTYGDGKVCHLDRQWSKSVIYWLGLGLTADDLISMIRPAMLAEKVDVDGKWRYFCGIVWTTIRSWEPDDTETAPEPPREPQREYVEGPDWFMLLMSQDAAAERHEPEEPAYVGSFFADIAEAIT